MLKELQESSAAGDWIASMRLALHFFHNRDTENMQLCMVAFNVNSPPQLGEYGVGLLRLAIGADVIPVITSLLQRDVSLDEKTHDGRRLLHIIRSRAAAQSLINRGADVNIRDLAGRTPLHYAISGEIAEVLAENGADVHATDHSGRTPLHTAQSASVVQVLLRYKADLMARDRLRHTPLHYVSSPNDEVSLEIMIASPETLLAKDSMGDTPLSLNVGKWQAKTIAKAFKLGAKVNDRNHNGTVALLRDPRALYGLQPEVATILIDYGATLNVVGHLGCTPLHFIASDEVMGLFLQHGCGRQVNQPDQRGNTPLHAVCNRDVVLKGVSALPQHTPALALMWQRNLLEQAVDTLGLLERLLRAGADPTAQNNDGDTPLHVVARNTVGLDGPTFGLNVALMQQLVRAGADINAQNARGETPLHCAAQYQTVHALLECGADPNLVDAEGRTVLHHVVRFTGQRKEVVTALVGHGVKSVDVCDVRGYTPLHSICAYRSSPMDYGKAAPMSEGIMALLEHGANVNARTGAGDTPLHLVARQWFQRDELKILVAHGADLDVKNGKGESVVMPWWRYEDRSDTAQG